MKKTPPVADWLGQPDGLAARLREIRTQAGLTGIQLAEAAGWSGQSRVSKIERARQMPTTDDVDAWVRVCAASDEVARELHTLLRGALAARHSWEMRLRAGQAKVQASYNQLVSESSFIGHFETAFVPGLLQTGDYIRRVLGEMVGLHGLDLDDVEAAVTTRLARQQLLYDTGKRFEFLLAEPVLRWGLCPPPQMRAQLDRLQTVIGMPNVRFGVLPMGASLDTTPQNSFQLYDDTVIVETFVGETIHTDDEALKYRGVLARLWRDAAEGEGARGLILDAVRALPQ